VSFFAMFSTPSVNGPGTGRAPPRGGEPIKAMIRVSIFRLEVGNMVA